MLDFTKFQEMVESTIDLDQIKNHLFLVKSSYQPELEDLRVKIDEVEDKLDKLADKAVKDLDLPSKSVKLESNSQNGYYFRVSRKVKN
jgi:DNA mismatch repair protein MSH2